MPLVLLLALVPGLLSQPQAAGGGRSEGRSVLRVGAAASLGDVLPPLLRAFREERGLPVEVSFGGSGELAAQARHGAPFDLLFLAGDPPMDSLEAAGLLLPGSRRALLANRLLLAAPPGAPRPFPADADLAGALAALRGRRLALAGPGAPAGRYARRWLATVDPALRAGVDLVPFDHVRAVLAAVEARSCAAGFVYATDAAGRLETWLEAPEALTGPIRYPAAVLSGSPRAKDALDLLDWLEAHREAFLAAGFRMPAEAPAPGALAPPAPAPVLGETPWALLRRSLLAAFLATVLQLPLAVGLGRLLARRPRLPGRAGLQAVLVLPMFLPPVAVGLLLLLALGPGGPLAALGERLLYRQGALVLAAAAVSFPLCLRHAQEAFAAVPARLGQVAASLGAGPGRIFWGVELPLAARGVAAGALLAFARGVGEYGATAVVAGVVPGRTETLATGIYRRLTTGDDRGALVLAGLAVLVGFAAVLASELLLRPRRFRGGGEAR